MKRLVVVVAIAIALMVSSPAQAEEAPSCKGMRIAAAQLSVVGGTPYEAALERLVQAGC